MMSNRIDTDKMKIGIGCYPSIGGSGVVATQLGQQLCERKFEVHFIAYDLPPKLMQLKNKCRFHHIHVPAYPLFRFPPYTLALATELTRLVKEVGLDLLHVHYAIPHSMSAVMANLMLEDHSLSRVPVITTVHGTDTELVGKEPQYKSAVEFSLNHCDALTAVSEDLRRSTLESFDCRKPIEVIYNFVDTDVFYPPPENCFPRNKDYWQIVHISNFRPVKRIRDVIQVFDLICKCVPCRLLMVGDGPDRPAAEEMVNSLGLSSMVGFTGRTVMVENILRRCDILLCTSENETFGMSIAEAMASGMPVVSSRVGGIPEVMIDGETGFLRPLGELEQMAEAIHQLITNPELAARMGQAGRERILQKFSAPLIVPQYTTLYERLAGRREASTEVGVK
jgi:N-acetyl-alpha-D-glucosaminyl L-malate synthase BshA